jgi:hypothetical protein
MKKKIFTLLASSFFLCYCRGQSLTPQVVANGGIYSSTTAGSLSATFGEMATTTLTGGANILTQGFQQAQPGVALPVTLLYFTAKLVNRQTQLEWKTSQEINSHHFEVQRSADGINFTQLLIVAAQGHSSTPHTYTAIDPSPFNDKTFYRLKQVDIDGRFVYSPIVMVRLTDEFVLSIFPNPAYSTINIQLTTTKKQAVVFELYNGGGQLVKSRNEMLSDGSNQFEWNISSLAAGMYFIVVKNIDVPIIKIIKQ